MKKKSVFILSFLFIIFLFPYLFKKTSSPQYGYVTKVIDGDTVRLNNGKLLRYLGINTPELRKKDKYGNWYEINDIYAKKAFLFNKNLVENKKIKIEYDKEREDRHGRLLGYVFVKDKFINYELLKSGWAELYIWGPNFKYQDTLAKAFKNALDGRKGIWRDITDISAKDAENYIGKPVILKDEVLDSYSGKNVILLFLPNNFRIVIYKDTLPLFEKNGINPLKYYLGKRIKVYGIVKKYKSFLEMIVHHPVEINIIYDNSDDKI
jgi:micrococcal nuclease